MCRIKCSYNGDRDSQTNGISFHFKQIKKKEKGREKKKKITKVRKGNNKEQNCTLERKQKNNETKKLILQNA